MTPTSLVDVTVSMVSSFIITGESTNDVLLNEICMSLVFVDKHAV